MAKKAFICALHSSTLGDDEKKFLTEHQPWGIIIFGYSARTKEQLTTLINDIKSVLGNDTMILVDQEGGRIQRLKPPAWKVHPAARSYIDAAPNHLVTNETLLEVMNGAQDIATELKEVGINVDCFPDMDVPVPGANDVIGDRAYSEDTAQVAILARAAAFGLMQGGALPVIKHMPGHGRATVNSHLALPTVTESIDVLKSTDFLPFKLNADLPMGMVAHIVYSAIDSTEPASQSAKVVNEVIREHIGFKGILMTDDLTMEALSGTYAERAQKAIAAGIDIVLICDEFKDQSTIDVANNVPEISDRVAELTKAALARIS